ncbi:MAG: ATP-dependent DNA ligase [Acidobacteriaceae bacterium]|nr:ATP-dependent DNA ligase [Acidobacteriaceae bacterium]
MENTLFAEVASLADALAKESSRLKKRSSIAVVVERVYREGASGDLSRLVRYLAGEPYAEADPRKLNAGGAILSRVVKSLSGATDAELTAAYRRHGDLGEAAFELLGKAPLQATLTLLDVSLAFDVMATARSTQAREVALVGMLQAATALEAKYLLKLMLGDMRIGVKASLIEEAIAVAATNAGQVADVAAVRHAVMLEADLGRAAEMAFAGTLAQARMRLFHPLGFMLASPVESPEEAVARFTAKPKPVSKPKKRAGKVAGELAVDAAEEAMAEDVAAEAGISDERGDPGQVHALLEDKFDGMRAQLHFGDPEQPGRVAIYSRNREDITQSFPELVEAFAKANATGATILDGEILGWEFAASRALPFAVLGQRIGRKRVDNDLRRTVPVVFMAFDVMFASGDLQLPRPLRERRALLEQLAAALQPQAVSPLELDAAFVPGGLFAAESSEEAVERLRISPAQTVESAEAIDRAYADARARANEGVMIKAAGSAYLPGRRGLAWVKLKRTLETLDVVITGAEFGSGRRSQVLSDYTFAVRGPGGELLNVGKAYSGLTDVEIAEMTEWLKAHTLADHGHFRTVEPLRVLEVAFNNIMRSDRHASGFALRFPRIVRLRDDKPVQEIDTLERVEEVFQSQPDKPLEGVEGERA